MVKSCITIRIKKYGFTSFAWCKIISGEENASPDIRTERKEKTVWK
uniref:Uncharacterized protein n=1 Tax=Ackermannviridae sp. ctkHJ36 TaxID=2825754 RepID=A0A8S5UKA2_9CAUD|nr:MAG TPA: hypothetical protein [Ackermannviridae sp. ctkHJ36]DAK07456.1 MAG TPA: hypothetical protein [Ackermannviridae sp.]DAP79445.1 MAG TPA: hypothetical protein [Ackermannviridae sp.]